MIQIIQYIEFCILWVLRPTLVNMSDYKVVNSLAVALQWCMLAAPNPITSKTFFPSPVITSGRLVASFQWLSSSIMRDEQMNACPIFAQDMTVCSSFEGFKLKQLCNSLAVAQNPEIVSPSSHFGAMDEISLCRVSSGKKKKKDCYCYFNLELQQHLVKDPMAKRQAKVKQ